jgi:hypothetical protein
MNDRDQDQHVSADGRILHVTVHGDNANELELAALDEARGFFGPDVHLEVVNDYQVTGTSEFDKDANGRKYIAGMRVRALNR